LIRWGRNLFSGRKEGPFEKGMIQGGSDRKGFELNRIVLREEKHSRKEERHNKDGEEKDRKRGRL